MSCSFLSFNIVLRDGENESNASRMREHTQFFLSNFGVILCANSKQYSTYTHLFVYMHHQTLFAIQEILLVL
jgi:hypothetical protein